MNPRKPFLLRVDPALLEALQKWAADELRSLNGQIEFVLRNALRDAGRLKSRAGGDGGPENASPPRGGGAREGR